MHLVHANLAIAPLRPRAKGLGLERAVTPLQESAHAALFLGL
jgi:hypothetical protein